MDYLAKKSFSFLQDCAFTSINDETCSNKWNILQKKYFRFCKIVHLLVLIINDILINGISNKKVVLKRASQTSKHIFLREDTQKTLLKQPSQKLLLKTGNKPSDKNKNKKRKSCPL